MTKVSLLILILLSGLHASMASDYKQSMFVRALREHSTAPLFVLVTVQNGNTGVAEDSAMPAPLLLWALSEEKHLSYEPASLRELRRIATSQSSRKFVFTSRKVLESLKRPYNSDQLGAARTLLGGLSSSDLKRQISSAGSALHVFYSRKSSKEFKDYEYALAHALLERGVLVGTADITGKLYSP